MAKNEIADPEGLPSGELRNLVRGLIWRDEHFGGATLRDIAKREKFSEGYIGKCIFMTFSLYNYRHGPISNI